MSRRLDELEKERAAAVERIDLAIEATRAELSALLDGDPVAVDDATGTIEQRVLGLMAKKPTLAWKNADLARKLWVQANTLGAVLSRMAAEGKVEKVARGHYKLPSNTKSKK